MGVHINALHHRRIRYQRPLRTENRPPKASYMKALDWFVRGVLAINFALCILSFVPSYSGIGQRDPGFSARLPGANFLYGWSADFLWICVSTPFIVVASVPFILRGGVTEIRERRYHRTAILCLVWIPCFLIYFFYNLANTFA